MEKLIIRGGNALCGDVNISGMKNSALPVIFGTIAAGDICTIGNVPDVSDISLALDTLRAMGAKVRFVNTDTVMIDTTNIKKKSPPLEYVSKMRGSSYLIGAMLGRFGKAQVGYPGGCDFGTRPINQHIKGFELLGAKIEYGANGNINATAPDGLKGTFIYFDIASVGSTINVMLAAIFAEGTTVIENAAREPHIVDTASFLNACGADISGAGTSMIRIRGVKSLHGCSYSLAPDMIEAGTYMAAVAATGGDVTVRNIIPKHMESVTVKLQEIGVKLDVGDDYIRVISDRSYRGTEIQTNPYPGFPTDMHPQFSAMLCLSQGVSKIKERVWNGRFKYAEELEKMGANIVILDDTAIINGVSTLHGTSVKSSDLRAGACLVIAGLAAEGETSVTGIEYIDRGYQDLVEKLKSLGADIQRVEY
ncbi:MAG: UDP-N-acetylglucosamine 1-carboxyvinyltransferase [Clostridia bacterium]|nr:UDP-N-acetylglucosamine 1-carboxyvinyltransferase [Clostridia bacterium]